MVNANQVRLKWPCIQSAQEKAKEKGGKKEKKEEKMGIKMKKKKISMRIHFPTVTPAP